MMKNVLCLGVLCILLFAGCTKDDRPVVCPENGDFGLDVVSQLGDFISSGWYYLTDESGNIKDEKYASSFPVFMNWTDQCEDTYTLHVAHFSQVTDPLGQYTFKLGASLLGVYDGQVIDELWQPEQELHSINIPQKSLRYDEIPPVDSMMTLGNSQISMSYSYAQEWIEVVIPPMTVKPANQYVYLCIRLIGEDDFRSLEINLSDVGYSLGTLEDFITTITAKEVSIPNQDIERVDLSLLVDDENERKIHLGNYNVLDRSVKLWVPQTDKPFLLGREGRFSENAYWREQEVVEEIPDYLTGLNNPVKNFTLENDAFQFEMTNMAYVFINSNNFSVPFWSGWLMQGPVDQGKREILIPPVNEGFENDHPEQDMRELWYSHLHSPTLRTYYFPTLTTNKEYWHISDLPWREQLNYQTVSLEIN